MSTDFYDTKRLNAISIIEVVRRLADIKRMGSVYKTLCPWHEDSKPSLTLYERTNENRCHCFACGQGGSVIDYVMQQQRWTFQEACQWLSREFGIWATQTRNSYTPRPKRIKRVISAAEPEYTYIPMTMVDEMVSADNSLCQCLMQMFDAEDVQRITTEYHLGHYSMNGKDDYTVFPNIDRKGRVCNLKIQHYETDISSPRFAHSDPGSCMWLGSIWSRDGKLPHNAQYQSKCLFGEHLLTKYPNMVVALVESPKNALFGAAAYPQMIWVATGNKTMLKREVLMPLKHRDIMVIPDCDAVEEWTEAIRKMEDMANFVISDYCKRMAPEGNTKYDIADLMQGLLLSAS